MPSFLLWLEIAQKIGLLVGGSAGLYLAWLRVRAANRQSEASLRQAELARREHVAELFNRAVGQLTDAKLEVRLGAIYTLREISRDFPDLAGTVVELLTAYLRENRKNYGEAEPPVDIREMINIVRSHMLEVRDD
jgi:hypothetical protein